VTDLTTTTVAVRGVEVPAVGYGTWQVTGRDAVEGVADALDLGYRHIDTARMYGNEAEVGRALADSPVDRDDVWLTTKVWMDDASAEGVRRSAESSLSDLRTDHVDLLLLHWPSDDVPLAETMQALDALQNDGKARHIGVSNFPSGLLAEAREHADLFAHQFEFHPYLVQPPLLEPDDLLLEAYSPFAHGRMHKESVLHDIGEAHGKSAGQVALRWLLDHPNVVVLPKASSRERRQENLDVFDFSLTDDERERIGALNRNKRTSDPPWAPDWD